MKRTTEEEDTSAEPRKATNDYGREGCGDKNNTKSVGDESRSLRLF